MTLHKEIALYHHIPTGNLEKIRLFQSPFGNIQNQLYISHPKENQYGTEKERQIKS